MKRYLTYKMLNILLILLTVLTVMQSSVLIQQVNAVYSGTAYDLKNAATVFYSETHSELVINNRLEETRISYKDKNQKLIGEKTLNYRKNSTLPDFKMEDKRTGYIEGTEVNGSNIKVFYREDRKGEMESKILSVPAPAVVDGGFNYFVKENFEKVKSGQKVTFNFVVPERLDYYSFRLTKSKLTKHNGKDAIVMKMEADSYILRQLIAPIVLTYDLNTKRLLQYEGISNISNDDGERYVVKIVYPVMGP